VQTRTSSPQFARAGLGMLKSFEVIFVPGTGFLTHKLKNLNPVKFKPKI
jgi:hypothetical protein